ncbi:hypothetical protein C5B78_18705 [Aeromonas salmonicida]|nr:hypothetical protein C5B78_18705 [Aeromonas salmonicida]
MLSQIFVKHSLILILMLLIACFQIMVICMVHLPRVTLEKLSLFGKVEIQNYLVKQWKGLLNWFHHIFLLIKDMTFYQRLYTSTK